MNNSNSFEGTKALSFIDAFDTHWMVFTVCTCDSGSVSSVLYVTGPFPSVVKISLPSPSGAVSVLKQWLLLYSVHARKWYVVHDIKCLLEFLGNWHNRLVDS